MKVLIAYYSTTGTTEKMAQYIAEGVRFSGHAATIKLIPDIKTEAEISGFNGYIFGSPTYSLDIPEPVKNFLGLVEKAGLAGKPAGTFGAYTHDVSYRHDNHAPAIIFDKLQTGCKMKPFELGPFILNQEIIDTAEGIKACQDYGRVFGEKLILASN